MVDSFLHTASQYYDEFVDPFLPAKNAFFIRAEHLLRYVFAQKFIQRKKVKIVFDVACGDGYGTKMLADVAKQIYGFDVSEKFLDVARTRYAANNITYIHVDLDTTPVTSLALPQPDVIVSFETIEHMNDPKRLLQIFFDVLPYNGYLLISTPNAKMEPKKHGKSRNIYHKHIFEKDQFLELLVNTGFEIQRVYGQPLTNIVLHKKTVARLLNKITERYKFMFNIFSYLGIPTKLFINRSYSIVVVARKK